MHITEAHIVIKRSSSQTVNFTAFVSLYEWWNDCMREANNTHT